MDNLTKTHAEQEAEQIEACRYLAKQIAEKFSQKDILRIIHFLSYEMERIDFLQELTAITRDMLKEINGLIIPSGE